MPWSDNDSMDDSDVELQDAFSKGLIKPGLNVPVLEQKKKAFVNDVGGNENFKTEAQASGALMVVLKHKLMQFKNNFKWIGRLDLVCKPAPLAPEVAVQLDEQESQSVKNNNNIAMNEFKRETNFHRQAQAAVLEGLGRLKNLGILTKRPEDYFAEMAKSDSHMQKVRALLIRKQAETEQTEKIRKIRQQKKISKQLQKEGKVKKQNEKKEMLDEIKKFRKGIRKDLDFLDNKKTPNSNPNKVKNGSTKSNLKRQYKDSKFGFGGRKRGLKANTRESSASMGDEKPFNKSYKAKKLGKNSKITRPGKSKRAKTKLSRRS